MNTNHVGTGIDILRSIVLVVLLAGIGSSVCLADQLQWNDEAASRKAVQSLVQESWLISYCSQADSDNVEVWLIRGVYVADTSAEGLSEIQVLAKCLYQSQESFAAYEFPLPEDRWHFEQVNDSGWGIAGIDLAYTYVYTQDSSFQCLGKTLDLQCQIGVETITLPDELMEALEVRSHLDRGEPLPWYHH
ncbi:hypothetical protein ACFLSW_04160 [Candidatus Bipolaricaulota bacterium]